MAEELATTTYSVSEPFEQAVRSLRKALVDGNIRLAGELDISSRIRQRLLISTTPCLVLLVTATPALEELGTDPCVAALTPLHIVVSARGSQAEIHLMRAVPSQDGPMERRSMAAFRQLQARITETVERIGMRANLGA